MSRDSATPPAQHVPNENLAANLASKFRRTPQRAKPNSAKKRRPLPDLSRSLASPGHGEKMSTIFRDASATLQGFRSPPYQPSSNITRSRQPFSQARGIRFGSVVHANGQISPRVELQSPGENVAREPISSSFTTPYIPYSHPPETPEEIRYPIFETWQLPPSSSIASGFGPDGNNSQSSHGILEVTSFSKLNTNATQSANIDSWLAGIPASSGNKPPSSPQLHDKEEEIVTTDNARLSPTAVLIIPAQRSVTPSASKPLQGLRSFSTASSNKENLSAVKSSPSAARSPPLDLPSTPLHFRNPRTQPLPQFTGTLRFAHPSTPQGHFSLPPKRKKARVDIQATSGLKPATSTDKNFTIHEDQLAGTLAELSPLVERHRKGRGPKRERCMSYFDKDVIKIGSPGKPKGIENSGGVGISNGRRVLGESKNSTELTRERPFLEGIEEAAFGFSV